VKGKTMNPYYLFVLDLDNYQLRTKVDRGEVDILYLSSVPHYFMRSYLHACLDTPQLSQDSDYALVIDSVMTFVNNTGEFLDWCVLAAETAIAIDYEDPIPNYGDGIVRNGAGREYGAG